jgi:hypothetical protein
MAAEWLRAALARRDPILPRALEFLLLPTRYIHPAWAERLVGAALWREAMSRRRGEAAISCHILARIGAGRDDAIAFDGKAARLALLDGGSLVALARRAGLALAAPAISRLVDRSSVLAIKAAVGAEAYDAAVREARLRPAPAVPPPAASSVDALVAEADALGWRTVAAALAGEPPALARRLRLKLAPGLELDPAPDLDRETSLRLLCRLAGEVAPPWRSLLA